MSGEVSAWVVDPSAPIPASVPDLGFDPVEWADACAVAFTDRDPVHKARKEQGL